VLPLHGELPPAEQDRALAVADTRRVVLATSIAETSLTVPGVRVVVDGGWRRTPRLDQSTGLTRLATLRISRAAAEQRAGRAGREAPGAAIRLWTPALHRGLAAFDRPEILEAELSALALTCAAWGTPPAALAFLDPPPPGALAAAEALLRELGALDAAGSITANGRRMAQLGAHPRLAAMLLAAESDGEAALAADLAALLEERDPLRGPPNAPGTSAEISSRLAAIADGDPAADRGALARIRQAAAQYRRRLHLPADMRPSGDPGRLLAAGFPDRIAQRRGEPGSFRLSGGGGARLPRTDPLANANLLAVAALEMRASAQIRLAAPLDPEALPVALAARVTETVETGFDPVSGAVFSRCRRRLGTLVLSDRTLPADPADTAAALARAVGAAELRPLPWTDTTRQLQARAALMRRLEPEAEWPDLSDPALTATTEAWLAPYLTGMRRLADLSRLDLTTVLRTLLPWHLAARLDQELPEHLALPGGRASVDYTQDPPLAAARAQAFFGLDRTPTLASGRVRPLLALLSPAGRPIAVTADLAGFWRGGWADARRDMRGRYPKHPWPDNPAHAASP
jgi:ATP-dependent helicase HrpB